MSSKLLSIITINLNDKIGLQKTIESVSEQTFDDYEFIVIDGGSQDGSIELLSEYEHMVDKLISEKDRGIYHAMNKGIKRAEGKYLYFLNAGDTFAKANVLTEVFLEPINASFICTNFFIESTTTELKIETPYRDRDWSFSMYDIYSGYLCHQAFFTQKTMFDKYGLFNETYKVVSDWELFFIAIGVHRESVVYKDVDMVIYNMDGLSSKIGGQFIYSEKKQVAKSRLSESVATKLDKLYQLEQDAYISNIVKGSTLLFFLVRLYGKLGRIFKKS